jgi:predicted permease
MWDDIRYGIRLLAKAPALTIVATLTIALSIGANTAVFTWLDALFLRHLPIANATRLVAIYRVDNAGEEHGMLFPMMEELERRQDVFTGICGWWGDRIFTTEVERTFSQSSVEAVTGDCHSLLGLHPVLGRLLEPADVQLRARVAVLSYNFWQKQYGGDPFVVGKTVRIEGLPFAIVGVAQKGYSGLQVDISMDMAVPLTTVPQIDETLNVRADEPRPVWMTYALAWIRPGITMEQARTQIQSIWPNVLAATVQPYFTPQRRESYLKARIAFRDVSNGFSYLRQPFTAPLNTVMAAASLVLLVACVNLSTIIIARISSRAQEMAVRVALGADRWRLTRQLITESMLLSLSGGLLGIILAAWTNRVLVRLMPLRLVPTAIDLRVDARVLGFSCAAIIVTAFLSALAPIWRVTRGDPSLVLQQNSRGISPGGGRFWKSLIIIQVALSVVLLSGAGLLVRSLEKLFSVNPGFRTRNILVLRLTAVPGGYRNLDNVSYYRELTEQLQAVPGVLSASMSQARPGAGQGWEESVAPQSASRTSEVKADFAIVTPEFFRTMALTLLRGRSFTWGDNISGRRVAIITESLARLLFPRGDALGEEIRIGDNPNRQKIEVIGIISDARISNIRDSRSFAVLVPSPQEPRFMNWSDLEVYTKGDALLMVDPVRRAVESLGHEYPVMITSIDRVVKTSLLQERITAICLVFFGLLTLFLSVMGTYGVTAYTTTQRTREFGIRMALGAHPDTILRAILGETIGLTGAGLVVGLPSALLGTSLISHMLYGVSPRDPFTLLFVSALLFAVAVLAGYLPARRAMSIDPILALRYE